MRDNCVSVVSVAIVAIFALVAIVAIFTDGANGDANNDYGGASVIRGVGQRTLGQQPRGKGLVQVLYYNRISICAPLNNLYKSQSLAFVADEQQCEANVKQCELKELSCKCAACLIYHRVRGWNEYLQIALLYLKYLQIASES